LQKIICHAEIIERGEREIAKLCLDLFYLLEIVGFAARAQVEECRARLITGASSSALASSI
jgi:hypothetical protein